MDVWDGDGVGVMIGIFYDFFVCEVSFCFDVKFFGEGYYVVGNVFFFMDDYV